jgi:spore germination protein GerM
MRRMWLANSTRAVLLIATACGAVACGDRSQRTDGAVADDPDIAEYADGEDTLAADRVATEPDSISVYFTREEQPVEVRRPVAGRAADIRTALEMLLAGPTAAERQRGIDSWFSDATSGMLRSVDVAGSRVAVDFNDLRQVIPNASTSTGSMLLMQELNATIFQYPEVHGIDYSIEGSCDAFWEWLQYECHTVTRPDQ